MIKSNWKVWLMPLALLFSAVLRAEIHHCQDGGGAGLYQQRPCASALESAVSGGHERHFLWEASAGDGTLYLLGSIHFGSTAFYPLPQVMSAAFDQADALVVEANILAADPARMAQLVAERALYRDGTTLRQQLSAATWQRLTAAAAGLELPVALLERQKPWFAAMTLTAAALNRLGYREDLGIDYHFLRRAEGRKPVLELEGVEWQLALFDGFTVEEQVAMLEETLHELDAGKLYFERMFDAWRSGDAEGIQALFDESTLNAPANARINRLLMTERNRTMAAALERLARQGGRYFVVVGAGHLGGDEGIIALLRQRGYRVMQR